MDIEELFKERSDEQISAFAFNTGRIIEHVIKTKVGDIQERNKELEAKILDFRYKIQDFSSLPHSTLDSLVADYDNYFSITSNKG